MPKGEYATARTKLEASQKAAPAAGTLLNLADCYEHLDLTASAWETYIEAREMAEKRQRADWVQIATDRIKLIEPRLARIRVIQSVSGSKSVRVDDRVVDALTLQKGMAVNVGQHRVVVMDDQGRERVGEVVARSGEVVEFVLHAPSSPRPPVVAPANPPASSTVADSKVDARSISPLVWVFGGAALASTAVGGVLFGIRHGERVDAKEQMQQQGCTGTLSEPLYSRCVNLQESPMGAGPPVVAFAVGGAFALAAVTTWLVGPKHGSTSAQTQCIPSLTGGVCTVRF